MSIFDKLFVSNTFLRLLAIVLIIFTIGKSTNDLIAQKIETVSQKTINLSTLVMIKSPDQESPIVKINVDINEKRNERGSSFHNLLGWVYVEDHDTLSQKVYVQLEKPDGTIVHYTTVRMERPEVGKEIKGTLYGHSGFNARIPLKDGLDIATCTIRLVVENMGGLYKSRVYQYGLSVRVKLPIQEIESQAVKINVDINEKRNERGSSFHNLLGWVYVEGHDTLSQKVYVQLEKPDGTIVHYTTVRMERPEVGKEIKGTLYGHSGFNARIPLKDGLDIDVYTIRFVVKNNNGIFKSRIWKYGINPRVEIKLQEPESRAVDYYLDVKEVGENGEAVQYYLTGWVYVKSQDTKNQEVYIRLKKPDNTVLHYLAWQLERPEVGIGFNNPLYDYSGFFAKIPLQKGLDINTCMIRLVVRNKSGTYVSHEWKKGLKSDAGAGKLSVFVAMNWLLVMLTSMILIVTIWRDRSLLLKPSIMAILFFHVMCQWGTALEAGRIEQFLPRPWVFVLLSHGFPMIGLAVSLLIWRRPVREIFGQVIDRKSEDLSRKNKALVLLALFFIAFMLLYFSHVPFRTTGLYKIIFSPAESGMARDMSVKFLDNAFLRYGHNIMMAVFAPLMAALTMQILLIHWQKRNWAWMAFYLACLVAIFLAASISGARSYSACIIMVILFALLLRRGFPLRPAYLVVIALLILTFPTLLSLLREGNAVTAKNFFAYLRGSTLDRVVIIPMKTGLYHVQYAQQHGYFGIKAIPKLAAVAGIESMNVPDFIAKFMSGSPLDTSTANTAYIYAYYSYFGLIAFMPCLLGLWLLDLCLFVYRRLSDTMLIPCVASVAIGVNIFSSVEYTVGLFTFGILLLPLASWAVDRSVPKIELAIKKKKL